VIKINILYSQYAVNKINYKKRGVGKEFKLERE